MDLELTNKRALITGASSGIGAATAQMFAEEGCDVAIGFHRNANGAEETAGLVKQAGRESWSCRMDVTNADEVAAAIAGLPINRLDIVVLCAGEAPSLPFKELTPAEWNRIIDVNLNGSFNVLRAVEPLMPAGSSIVTVASVAAHTGVPHHAHYAAAKAGLVNLTKSAARALSPRIRVNCVAPGMTLTKMGRQTAASLPDDYAQQKLLVGRFAEPREIANCIAFLASPVSAFITGATLDANGGRDLR